MELTLNRISPENQKNAPASMEGVVFGTVFSNHMFSMVWDDGMGWHDAEIKPLPAFGARPLHHRSPLRSEFF